MTNNGYVQSAQNCTSGFPLYTHKNQIRELSSMF